MHFEARFCPFGVLPQSFKLHASNTIVAKQPPAKIQVSSSSSFCLYIQPLFRLSIQCRIPQSLHGTCDSSPQKKYSKNSHFICCLVTIDNLLQGFHGMLSLDQSNCRISLYNVLVIIILCMYCSCAVPEAPADSVWEGPVSLYGAVGVSQWGGIVPCLLHIRAKEEHRGAPVNSGPLTWVQQVCGELPMHYSIVSVFVQGQ